MTTNFLLKEHLYNNLFSQVLPGPPSKKPNVAQFYVNVSEGSVFSISTTSATAYMSISPAGSDMRHSNVPVRDRKS